MAPDAKRPYFESASCPWCGREVSIDLCERPDGHRCAHCSQPFMIARTRHGLLLGLEKPSRFLSSLSERALSTGIAIVGVGAAAYGIWAWVLPTIL